MQARWPIRIQRSVQVGTSNSNSDSEQQSCWGKDKPVDGPSLYTYIRCKTRYNKKRAMRSFG